MEKTKTHLVHTIRHGRVQVVIWKNETDNGDRYNMTVSQGYKDGDECKDSPSIGHNYGCQAARAFQLDTDWIFQSCGQAAKLARREDFDTGLN